VGGAGFIAYKTFFAKSSWAKGLQQAQTSYAKGLEALEKNPKEAAVAFDEAVLSSENAIKDITTELNRGIARAELDRPNAELNWLKARAIRDRAYAKAKADGNPLQESTDTSSNEKYRSYLVMPEQKDLNDVYTGMRNALGPMNDNPEYLKDATRMVLAMQPIDWSFAESVLRDTVKLNPKDARANFFLAKYDFEQPSESSRWAPTDPGRRDRNRVADAAKSLEAAKAAGAPYWRVVHMEAEMLEWEAADEAKNKQKAAAEAKRRSLEALLFGKDGALDRASRGMHFDPLSTYDARGILAVHHIAMRQVLDTEGGAADKVVKAKQVLQSLLAATGHLGEARLGGGYVEDAGNSLAQLLGAAQPIMLASDPNSWKGLIADTNAIFQKYPLATNKPTVVLEFAKLGHREGFIDPVRRQQINTESLKKLEAGLARAKEAKQSPEILAEYHLALGETKLLNNVSAAEVESHIAELRKVDNPRIRGVTNFLEGVLAHRQGKLEKARTLLETVTTDREMKGTDHVFSAITQLADITLASGDPNAAAGYYAQLSDAFTQIGTLNPTTRAWLELTATNREEVVAKQVIATAQAGLQRIDKLRRENPGAAIPPALIQQTVTAMDRLMKGLKPPTTADRTARLNLIAFLVTTKQVDLADKLLTALAADYPDSVEVAQAQVSRIMLPSGDKKEPDAGAQERADELLRKFVKTSPSRGAKLLWARWLMQTKRSNEAAAYLKDPSNFPDQDPVVSRLLANALFSAGSREEANKVLASMPADPAVDIMIAQAADTKEAAEKGLDSALKRYENNGLLRVYTAARRLTEGKYEEAAREFHGAYEFTQVKAVASAGLARSLVMLAASDPVKASKVIGEYIADKPNDPALYPAAALAALYLDDVGEPADTWGAKRTMYAAINRWDQLATAAEIPSATVGLTKSQYHLFAGNPGLARVEALRTVGKNQNHVPTLNLLADLFMAEPDRDLAKAKEFIDRAQNETKSEDPTPFLLEGKWFELKKDYDSAAKLYERMTTQFATSPVPFARRVGVAAAQNKTGEAILWATKWLDKWPDDVNATVSLIHHLAAAGDSLPEAVKKADEFVAKQLAAGKARVEKATPPPDEKQVKQFLSLLQAQSQLQMANAFYHGKQLAEAKRRVELVLKEIPDSPAALLMAGDIALNEKDWTRAEDIYRKRIKAEPRDFVAANNLAWLLVDKKSAPAEAFELVKQVRASATGKPLDPKRLPVEFLDTIGTVYVKLNDPAKSQEMRETFEGAVKRYPKDPRMLTYLGQAYATLGQRSQALASFDTAIKLTTDPTVTGLTDEQKQEAKKAAEAARAKIAQ
jgi:predicted Zn-dependent protease